MKFIKDNIKDLLYILLFGVIIFQTCGKYTPKEDIIKRDTSTFYTFHDSTIKEKPIITNINKPSKETIIEKYYYDTSAKDLKERYLELAQKFEALKVSEQKINIDSIGYINIKDTVSQNEIKGRSVNYNIKQKETFIKETIIKQAEPKRQLFYGGELGLSPTGVNSALGGIMYKDRRDNIYKFSGGLDLNRLQPQLQIGYYKPLNK